MNWILLFNSSLAFGLLFVVLLTLTFFINYKRDRRNATTRSVHPTRGRYFVRHVPDVLSERYRVADGVQRQGETRWEIKKFRMISYIPATAFSVALAFFLFQFGHLLQGPSTLTEDEIENLRYTDYTWRSMPQPDSPKWVEIQKAWRGRKLIMLSAAADAEWTHPHSGRPWVKNVLTEWRTWAETAGISVQSCDWKRAQDCGAIARDIYLVAPGRWDMAKLDRLLARGASILLLGAPLSVFGEQRNFIWQDLAFEKAPVATSGPLVLAGDQMLTLGLSAGRILPLAATENGYRVQSEMADAYRLSSKWLFTEQVDSALYAKTVGRGRFVWADYSPLNKAALEGVDDAVEQMNTAVFRYLLRKSYESVAVWPEGKSAAAFVSADVEHDLRDLQTFTGDLNDIGWFLLTQTVEREPSLVKDLVRTGELACHGDVHDHFDTDSLRRQTQRLALCKKIVAGYATAPALGFRPPEERFNNDTLSAAADAGYDYLFVGRSGAQATPQVFKPVGTPGPSLVVISRVVADDHFLYSESQLTDFDRKKIVDNDWAWMQRLRGLHTYSFHSQNLSAPGHPDLIRTLLSTLQNGEVFMARPSEIVAWWRFRDGLLSKAKMAPAEMAKFKPVKLSVNSAGQLSRTPLFVERGTASERK